MVKRSPEMPGFFKPQLATLKAKAPSGDQWIHEIKFDGYRVQVHVNRGKRKVYTRNGLDWTKRFSVIASALDMPGQAALDGEVVVIHEGRTNFSELQAELAAGRQDRLVYYAFDLLWRDGDLRQLPQLVRKQMLSDILGENDIGLPLVHPAGRISFDRVALRCLGPPILSLRHWSENPFAPHRQESCHDDRANEQSYQAERGQAAENSDEGEQEGEPCGAADEGRPHEMVTCEHDDRTPDEYDRRGESAAARRYRYDRRHGERHPRAERDHGERGRKDQKGQRVRNAGHEIDEADRDALADGDQHCPVHGRARRIHHFFDEALSSFAKETIAGLQDTAGHRAAMP